MDGGLAIISIKYFKNTKNRNLLLKSIMKKYKYLQEHQIDIWYWWTKF